MDGVGIENTHTHLRDVAVVDVPVHIAARRCFRTHSVEKTCRDKY